jgi:thiol-disulfide isomerase/thioredoxin
MKRMLLLLSLLIVVTATPALFAAELPVGATAPQFTLVNALNAKSVSFRPGDGKVSVVIFTCNQCPFARAFEPRILDLARQYQPKGVVFYAIDPNDDTQYPIESLAEMKARASEKGYPFPYLKDGDSSIARAYGARVTPHVYLIDGSGTLRYRGYVDDSAKPEERHTTGLTDALDDLLAGKPVANQTTHAFGCSIKFSSEAKSE